MKDFKKLNVWVKAHELVIDVYRMTECFPSIETYGLTSQIRRSGASIPANIAEGCGRNSEPELLRFFQIAAGSANELEYHLLLAHDLGYLSDIDYQRLNDRTNDVKRMLVALYNKIKASS